MNHLLESDSFRIPAPARPARVAPPKGSPTDRELYIQSLARLRAQGLLRVDPEAIADAILRREQPYRNRQ
jgi:hypothetical protein